MGAWMGCVERAWEGIFQGLFVFLNEKMSKK
jgi:hypothetical protein